MTPVLKQFVLLFVLGFFGTVSNDITVRLELAKSDLDISLMYNQTKSNYSFSLTEFHPIVINVQMYLSTFYKRYNLLTACSRL